MTARTLGRLLAVWSFGFAWVHVAWAAGWRAGVPAGAPPIGDRPWFLAYDLTAGALMFCAAAVAWTLARGRRSEALTRLTVAGAVLALLRGVPALAMDLAAGDLNGTGVLADAWFTVAGLLGLALVRAASHPAAVPASSTPTGARVR